MVRQKSTYRIDVGTTGSVYLKAFANIISGITSELGWTLDEDGVPPPGRVIIAENREDALDRGLVPFRITYNKNRRRQSSIVLAAPDRADTVADDLLGKSYNGGTISRVTAPRRVRYTAG